MLIGFSEVTGPDPGENARETASLRVNSFERSFACPDPARDPRPRTPLLSRANVGTSP
jgi:hypothetical protein